MKVLELSTWTEIFGPEILDFEKLQEYLDFVVQAVKNYDPERYSEWHHVMPKCIDKDKKFRDQGVRINGADHFRAHMKLAECFNHSDLKYKLVCSMTRMRRSCKTDLTPEEFEKVRQIYSSCKRVLSKESKAKVSRAIKKYYETHENPFKGHTHTQETKDLISKSQKDHYRENLIIWINNFESEIRIKEVDFVIYESLGYIKGRLPLTESCRDKLKEAFAGSRNPMYGKTHTDEVRQRISEKVKALPKKIWINNGKVNKMIYEHDLIPDGWTRGRGFIKKRS